MKISIPKFLEDLAIISKLGDNPGADNGLSANALKAKFDEAVLKLQDYLNNTVVETINSIFSLDAPAHEGMNMTGPINMNGQPISGLNEPTANDHAVNKQYADNIDATAQSALDTANDALDIANDAKETADSAMPKTGGTFNGNVVVAGDVSIKKASWPTLLFKDGDGANIGRIALDTSSNRVCLGQSDAGASFFEGYLLPSRASALIASKFYEILTTKNAVTIAQGGTGATTAADALNNLGITYSTGSGTRTTTYTDGKTFTCKWFKFGRIVQMWFQISLNSSAASTWTDYQLATGLPAPVAECKGWVSVDNVTYASYCVLSTSGTLFVSARQGAIASQIVYGGITYVSAS